MKIVHVCLGCFYIDNSTYQENLLPKYHKQIGHEVEIVASLINQKDGRFIVESDERKYINEHGILVTRLQYKAIRKLSKKLGIVQGLEQELENKKPDIIFIHGLQSLAMFTIVKYARAYPNVRIFVDNHCDTKNSAKNIVSKYFLHGFLWRICASRLNPYVTKFYGVLPARVDFLKSMYHLPPDKVHLLVLGVDDDLLHEAKQSNARNDIRSKYGITDNSVVFATGGKINADRPETLQLMKAIKAIGRNDIHLFVFGNVIPELQKEFDDCCESEYIHYMGWVNTKQIYEIFQASDVISFPGLHSVLWEQAAGSGKACIFKRINGFEHVDLGGNCMFFEDNTQDYYEKMIIDFVDSGIVKQMTLAAEQKGITYFSYKNIAMRSIV